MVRKKLTKEQRKQVYDMFNGHCAYCGCEIALSDMQVDHIVSLHRDGADDLSNMFPACRSCNKYKSTLTLDGFRKALERMPTVLQRDSTTYRIAVRYGLIIPNEHKVEFYFEKALKADGGENNDREIL